METNIETIKTETGTKIVVNTKADNIAVIIRDKTGERIYLPHEITKNTETYYVETRPEIEELENGYVLKHPAPVEDIQILT